MRNKITHAARAELANAIRRRYQSATGRQKRKILDEFVATTGYHEKSAIRVLNGQPTAEHRQTRKRPSIYDEAARGALVVLWEASDRVCGKRLKALLPIAAQCDALEDAPSDGAGTASACAFAHLCRLE